MMEIFICCASMKRHSNGRWPATVKKGADAAALDFIAARRPPVRRLQILVRLVQRVLRVVFGADCLLVFVYGPIPLIGDIKDLAEIDMGPNLGPFGLAVPVDGLPEFIGRGLIVALQEKYFCDAVMRQGAVSIHVEGFLVLLKRLVVIPELRLLLALLDRHGDPDFVIEPQYFVVWIQNHSFGLAESIDREFRRRARHLDLLPLRLTLGFNEHLHWHA